MKISKEVRIGVLATVSLLIFFIGYYFLKGANLFSNNKEYYCNYLNVDGLQNSANVQIRGLNVGHVSAMRLLDDKGVRVTIAISKKIELPQGTVASLETVDLLGAKVVKLIPGSGPEILKPGSELTPNVQGGAMENVSGELTPRLQELKATIIAVDSALAGINAMVGTNNQRAIAAAIESIKTTADNLSKLSATLNSEGSEISSIVHNTNSITGNFAKNNDTVNRILANFSNASRQLANAPIQKAVADLQGTITEFRGIADKINNNQGSLGMLINNKDVYNNANRSLKSLDSLMSDIKAHPTRYINVTVFGKKKN